MFVQVFLFHFRVALMKNSFVSRKRSLISSERPDQLVWADGPTPADCNSRLLIGDFEFKIFWRASQLEFKRGCTLFRSSLPQENTKQNATSTIIQTKSKGTKQRPKGQRTSEQEVKSDMGKTLVGK